MGGTYDPGPQPSAEKHIEAMKQRAAPAERPWSNFKDMIAHFDRLKADLNHRTGSDAAYYGELDLFDVKHATCATLDQMSRPAFTCSRFRPVWPQQ
jgi:hypothetical protein